MLELAGVIAAPLLVAVGVCGYIAWVLRGLRLRWQADAEQRHEEYREECRAAVWEAVHARDHADDEVESWA